MASGDGDFWSRFDPVEWRGNDTLVLDGESFTPPERASCVNVFSVPLGDASRLAAFGVEANTDVVFSPDEKKIAVGTHLGDVFIVDAFEGNVLTQSHFAEGMVKFLRWSNDGLTLYAAEQSPDAYVYALNASDLSVHWKIRLADTVESSPLPGGEDVYGVYSLPAAYGLDVLKSDQIVITAAHSWGSFGTDRRNLSQILLVSERGEVTSKWPNEPADVVMKHSKTDENEQQIAVIMSRSDNSPQISTVPSKGVQILDLPDLSPVGHIDPEPLAPYFEKADIWEGFSFSDDLLIGLVDGRLSRVATNGETQWEIEPSTPMMAGDVPIHASVGWGQWVGDSALFTTSVTYIPFGANVPDQQPPMAHPQSNRLVLVDSNGEEHWSWQGAPIIQGLSVREDLTEALIGGGMRQGDERRDAFGGFVLDLRSETASSDRLSAHCATESPVFFRHALASDGRVALIELPFKSSDGVINGQYQLSVMR